MKTTIKVTIAVLMAVFFAATGIIAQNNPDTIKAHQHMMKKDMQKNKMMCDSTMMKNHKDMDHKAMMKDGAMMCDSSKMMKHKEMMKDHKGMMDHGSMNHSKMESSIVREGVIDVAAIDKNDDGKVYQDMMDWNVISDEPGKCPNCGMKLKEVSINDAKNNLKKNGFKVK